MNFLAHLYFAEDDGRSMIGNLMPDMVRGRRVDDLDPVVQHGVDTHRLIDRLTDTHPAFGRTKARLLSHHGLFAGVLVDIFYDHVLAGNWRDYHDEPLPAFSQRIYTRMAEHRESAPPIMQSKIENMAKYDWLTGYASVQGMTITLHRTSERFAKWFRRTFDPDVAVGDMLAESHLMREEFNEVFAHIFLRVLTDQSLLAGRHLPPASREMPAAIPKTT